MYKLEREMRIGIVISLVVILAVALLVLFSAPEPTLGIHTTELVDGVKVENVGNVDCLIFVSSLEGEQRFELAVGESVTVTDMAKPIEVSAVSK